MFKDYTNETAQQNHKEFNEPSSSKVHKSDQPSNSNDKHSDEPSSSNQHETGEPSNIIFHVSSEPSCSTSMETGEPSNSTLREYDIIAPEDVHNLEHPSQSTIAKKPDEQEVTSNGIIQIQNGLLKLLREFILILPDLVIKEVLMHYVTIEVVLIMANHQDPSVRASIIQLLAVMCERFSDVSIASYKKLHCWHHLGNQIALFSVNMHLMEAVVHWITGLHIHLDDLVVIFLFSSYDFFKNIITSHFCRVFQISSQ